MVSDLTWTCYRDHLVLEYEIPKFDGDLGQPNSYVALDAETLNEKIQCLLECFSTQADREWFTGETFKALARLRGIECNAPSGFAEAFYSRKLRLAI